MDDNTLFSIIADGRRDAFDSLVDRYVVPLNVFAGRITGDSEAARDIVQDAFVYVWENRRKMESVGHIHNYLYLAVRNYSLNWMKRLSRSGRLPESIHMADEDISAQYIRTETARLLKDAIDSLPERTAEVIRLSLDGVKQEEIAERLNISLATVKAQKARGIVRLREILGPLSYLIFMPF